MSFFFFNDTATTEIYPLSLHDALPISREGEAGVLGVEAREADGHGDLHGQTAPRGVYSGQSGTLQPCRSSRQGRAVRSEEHTSELQSRQYLVCRLLLEKKKSDEIEHLL